MFFFIAINVINETDASEVPSKIKFYCLLNAVCNLYGERSVQPIRMGVVNSHSVSVL